VPPDVARRMLSGEEGLALKANTGSVRCWLLVSGVLRSTANTCPPNILYLNLKRVFFGRMADVVHDHQGTLDKFNWRLLAGCLGGPRTL